MEFEKITDYIQALYQKKPFLKQADYTSHMKLKGYIPTVDDEMACFLRLLIRIAKPKNILEIGTSVGFSTVSMALAAKGYGGRITTIEYDRRAADQAEENFMKAGVLECVMIKRGDAREILRNLSGEYDLIFQDVDKKLYDVLLDDCIRLLKKDGILLSDDALFPVLGLDKKWGDLAEPVGKYNELVIGCSRLESALLPIGDGVMVSVKK